MTSGLVAIFRFTVTHSQQGMFDIGRLKDGDTVVVSGAAGSVGLIAVQIALAHPKCRVAAIAGSADKCEKLKKMGCHSVFNYKDANFKKDLKKFGLVDVYFDNGEGIHSLACAHAHTQFSRRRDPGSDLDPDQTLCPYHRMWRHLDVQVSAHAFLRTL